MTITPTNVKLVEAYKKQPVRVRLAPRRDMGPFAPREAVLAPVLYHGTARVRILEWQQRRGISVSSFSLACSWFAAAIFATYKVDRLSECSDSVYLQNNIARQIITNIEDIQQTGFCEGFVTNSIAFFDRDSLLELPRSQFEIQGEETHGFCLRRKSRSAAIPLNSLIAAISFLPDAPLRLEVFNRALWDANFNVPPPSLEGSPSWATFDIRNFPAEFLAEILGDSGILE